MIGSPPLNAAPSAVTAATADAIPLSVFAALPAGAEKPPKTIAPFGEVLAAALPSAHPDRKSGLRTPRAGLSEAAALDATSLTGRLREVVSSRKLGMVADEARANARLPAASPGKAAAAKRLKPMQAAAARDDHPILLAAVSLPAVPVGSPANAPLPQAAMAQTGIPAPVRLSAAEPAGEPPSGGRPTVALATDVIVAVDQPQSAAVAIAATLDVHAPASAEALASAITASASIAAPAASAAASASAAAVAAALAAPMSNAARPSAAFTGRDRAAAMAGSSDLLRTAATPPISTDQPAAMARILAAAATGTPVPRLGSDRDNSTTQAGSEATSGRSPGRPGEPHTANSSLDDPPPPAATASSGATLNTISGTSDAASLLHDPAGQAPPGSPERSPTTANRVAQQSPAAPGEPGFSIDSRLLGPVSAALLPPIASGDRLHVRFTVDRLATAALITGASDRLDQTLNATGMRLGSLAVAIGPRVEPAAALQDPQRAALPDQLPAAPLAPSTPSAGSQPSTPSAGSPSAMSWSSPGSAPDTASGSGTGHPRREPESAPGPIRPVRPPVVAAPVRDRFA